MFNGEQGSTTFADFKTALTSYAALYERQEKEKRFARFATVIGTAANHIKHYEDTTTDYEGLMKILEKEIVTNLLLSDFKNLSLLDSSQKRLTRNFMIKLTACYCLLSQLRESTKRS